MPRGRNRILDEAKQREVCALISSGCSLQAAAHYVQCAPNTIRREAARNPDFGRRFREARLQAQLSPLQAMRKAANSHWRAAAWMLERADPEHFDRRPSPAFRPKQAQTLRSDILAILSAEIDNPFLLKRVRRQIQHLMQYAIDGVVRVKRTNGQLRTVLREIDKLENEANERDRAAYDATFHAPPTGTVSPSNHAPPSNSARPSNPEPRSNTGPPTNTNQNADPPATWRDMAEELARFWDVSQHSAAQNDTAQNANGKPASAKSPAANS